jgi:mono/diheme cytochrome c family protein
MAAIFDSIPHGVLGRNRSSPLFPPAVPDLHGIRDRRYLDKSGLNQHRSMVDLMRYAAMAEGIEFLSSFDGFIPLGGEKFDQLPQPEKQERFSEAQLYALAMWLSSLEPPPNPNPRDAQSVAAGKKIFEREWCGTCHTPPLYTNNKLTPAKGFTVPGEHRSRYDILPMITTQRPRGDGHSPKPVSTHREHRGIRAAQGFHGAGPKSGWVEGRRSCL